MDESMADLSQLSMEEKTFLQLCKVGLIRKSIFPTVELVLEDDDDPSRKKAEDDLVNVIGEMTADLSTLTARNNARIGYLESALDPTELAFRKQWEEAEVEAKEKTN